MDRYRMGVELGSGSFGDVFECVLKENGEKRAMKHIRGNFTWDHTVRMREIQAMFRLMRRDDAEKNVGSSNIVQLHDILCEGQQIYFVLEFMDRGNLQELICRQRQVEKRPFSQVAIVSLTKQLLEAVHFLHSRKYMHRDIKPENVLLSSGGRNMTIGNDEPESLVVKLADFSLARRLDESRNGTKAQLTSYVSTRWYRSPECLLYNNMFAASPSFDLHEMYGTSSYAASYSLPVDIFAFGCVAAEVLKLNPLFPGDSDLDRYHRIVAVLGSPPVDDNASTSSKAHTCDPSLLQRHLPFASPIALDLLHNVLNVNPTTRWTAEQTLKHLFYSPKAALPYDHPFSPHEQQNSSSNAASTTLSLGAAPITSSAWSTGTRAVTATPSMPQRGLLPTHQSGNWSTQADEAFGTPSVSYKSPPFHALSNQASVASAAGGQSVSNPYVRRSGLSFSSSGHRREA